MARYLLISSRDPFESADTSAYYELAAGLAREGNEVAVFLVQNGVLTARAGADVKPVDRIPITDSIPLWTSWYLII